MRICMLIDPHFFCVCVVGGWGGFHGGEQACEIKRGCALLIWPGTARAEQSVRMAVQRWAEQRWPDGGWPDSGAFLIWPDGALGESLRARGLRTTIESAKVVWGVCRKVWYGPSEIEHLMRCEKMNETYITRFQDIYDCVEDARRAGDAAVDAELETLLETRGLAALELSVDEALYVWALCTMVWAEGAAPRCFQHDPDTSADWREAEEIYERIVASGIPGAPRIRDVYDALGGDTFWESDGESLDLDQLDQLKQPGNIFHGLLGGLIFASYNAAVWAVIRKHGLGVDTFPSVTQ